MNGAISTAVAMIKDAESRPLPLGNDIISGAVSTTGDLPGSDKLKPLHDPDPSTNTADVGGSHHLRIRKLSDLEMRRLDLQKACDAILNKKYQSKQDPNDIKQIRGDHTFLALILLSGREDFSHTNPPN